MICCDQDVTTKFCPHCGKEVIAHHISGLIGYCDANLKSLQKRSGNWQNNGHPRAQKNRANCQRSIEKWTAWREWIMKHIEADRVSSNLPSKLS